MRTAESVEELGTVRRRSSAFLFVLVMLSCAAHEERSDSSEDLAPVRAEIERYYADFSSRDWKAYADHFWPGATLTTIWQPPWENAPRVVATSVPDFVAQAPQGPDSKSIFEERMTGAEVKRCGSLAQVWAGYSARFGEPGDVMEWSGVDAFTLLEHDGRWRIVSLAWIGEE